MEYIIYNGELFHYGLKGMKWGTRRWQYADGRFNDAGKARYFGQNSSHRPDSVRALQGDPAPRKTNTGIQSSGKERSFDKDKAKRIAKKVAIGTAIVAGTVLVVYGGYKVHQAGGFSTVSKNLKAKMRETKLEDLKLKKEYKAKMAEIKSEGRARLAAIKQNTKTELAGIREKGRSVGKTKVRNVGGNIKASAKKIVNAGKKVKLPKIPKDYIEAGTKFLSELNKTVTTASGSKQPPKQRDDEIVRMYKAQHPNTKLSDKKILENYSDMIRE